MHLYIQASMLLMFYVFLMGFIINNNTTEVESRKKHFWPLDLGTKLSVTKSNHKITSFDMEKHVETMPRNSMLYSMVCRWLTKFSCYLLVENSNFCKQSLFWEVFVPSPIDVMCFHFPPPEFLVLLMEPIDCMFHKMLACLCCILYTVKPLI